MKVKDIIKDDKFNEFLGYEIEAYNNRPAPQEGCRYRRTPYDALKDAGIFTVEGIRETFIKVANLESGLPEVPARRNNRACIQSSPNGSKLSCETRSRS